MTGYEAGCRRGQIDDAGGDLHGVAQSAHGGAVEDRLHGFFGDPVQHPGLHEARGNGVHRHASAGVLPGQRLGEPDQAGLGGGVVGLAEVADAADDAGDVDDPSPVAGRHPLDEMLGDVEDAGQVGVDDRVPHLPVHLAERPIPGDAGVVDQDVDAVEVVAEAGAHGLDLAAHPHVEGVGAGPASEFTDLAANRLGGFSAGETGAHRDVGAGRRQRQRRGPADPSGAAGHEGPFPLQAEARDQTRRSNGRDTFHRRASWSIDD